MKQKSYKTFEIGSDDVLDEVKEEREQAKVNLNNEEIQNMMKAIRNMTHSSNMQSVVGSLNLDRRRRKFVEKVEDILKKFENIKLDNDDERIKTLFLFVMQSANDYLEKDIKKDEIVLELLKKIVTDEFLCKNIINIVKERVKPLTFYRKYKHTILKGFGFFFMSMFARAN